jgi:hypothetical protein
VDRRGNSVDIAARDLETRKVLHRIIPAIDPKVAAEP